MSSIGIERVDITRIKVDAIVNAANSGLQAGGGVCGAIFAAAGHGPLQAACDEIGGCPTGEAVITPGFNLPAKYVIHAVGPIWSGGMNGEPEALYNAYQNSLMRALENDCHSIAFPLISSGIYGYPKADAWEKAVISCSNFLDVHDDYELDVIFCVIDDITYEMGDRTMARILGAESEIHLMRCEPLEEALDQWHRDFMSEEPEEVLDILFDQLHQDLQVVVPVKYEGGIEDDDHMYYQVLDGEDGSNLLACFTNFEELARGEESPAVVMTMTDLMDEVIAMGECEGIAINPWGNGILIPTEVIAEMLSEMRQE